MASDADIVLQGWLTKTGDISKGTLKGRNHKYWFVLWKKTNTAVARLEYFQTQRPPNSLVRPKGITLVDSITSCRIVQHKKKPGFEIVTAEKSNYYLAEDDEAAYSWSGAINNITSGGGERKSGTLQRTPLPDIPSRKTSTMLLGRHTQENLIYGSSDELSFTVKVKDTSFARQLNIEGEHTLAISTINLTLFDNENGDCIGAWPIRYLRRYGRDSGVFSFESGRKCESGPGVLYLETDQPDEIFKEVDRHAKNIAQAARAGGSTGTIKSVSQEPTYHHLSREASRDASPVKPKSSNDQSGQYQSPLGNPYGTVINSHKRVPADLGDYDELPELPNDNRGYHIANRDINMDAGQYDFARGGPATTKNNFPSAYDELPPASAAGKHLPTDLGDYDELPEATIDDSQYADVAIDHLYRQPGVKGPETAAQAAKRISIMNISDDHVVTDEYAMVNKPHKP